MIIAASHGTTFKDFCCILLFSPEVVAGALHTCAILLGHLTKCWGWGYYGQLGNGNSTNIGDDANEILGI